MRINEIHSSGYGKNQLGGVYFYTLLVSMVFVFCLPGSLLYQMGWGYQTLGGNFLEKIHPASYLIICCSTLALLNLRGLIVNSAVWGYLKVLVIYALIVLASAFYAAVFLGKSIALFVDTWLILAFYPVLWMLCSDSQIAILRRVVIVAFVSNFAFGLYEFFSGNRLVPLILVDIENMGDVLDVSDWSEQRPTALFGLPLNASFLCGVFFLINYLLLIKIKFSWPVFFLMVSSFLLMIIFGGRASIFFAGFVLLFVTVYHGFGFTKSLAGRRSSLISLFMISGLFILVVIFYSLGFFDLVLSRLLDDKGSSLARFAVFEVLFATSYTEFLFGDFRGALFSRQINSGLFYGIEISWLNLILNFGFLLTSVLVVGAANVYLRFPVNEYYFNPLYIYFYVISVGSTAVYFSSKSYLLLQVLILITLFSVKTRLVILR